MIRFFCFFAGYFLVGLAGWIGRTFDSPTIEQIIYHLRYSEGAAVQMGEIFILTFVMEVVAFPLAFAAATAVLQLAVEQWRPAWRARGLTYVPGLAITAGVGAVLLQLSAFSYAASYFAPDRFSQLYVDPKTVQLRAERPRNLVLIYVESLEDTYSDAGLFGRDLLAPLRTLGGESFAFYRPVPGATWTIAGMVATQCGVPLRVYSEYGFKHDGNSRAFMAGATCLGDLLKERGYRNVFLGGAPLSFAGKGAFLRDHGYQEAYGRDEWEKLGVQPAELNEWGLYDSALFERARKQLQVLHASGQHFNMTLLTLDTHNPHGFLSPYCRSRGARDFEGIVACASTQLADFVQFMRAQGYLEDTTVVILGDHLAVPNPAFEKLRQAPQRTIFNMVFAQPQPPRNTQELLPFDMFPTLLEMAGIGVVGDRLALGYSAVYEPQAERAPDRIQNLALPGLAGSDSYNTLWRQRPAP